MSFLENARTAWQENGLPDWVEVLAIECDRTSQNKVATRLNRSAAFVSNIVRNKYGASLFLAEEVVRGTLMSETITCPVLGDIGKQICLQWRTRSREFSNINSLHVTMYRACNRCPRHTGGKDA